MTANPLLGLIFHWIGGLAAASFYIPFRGVRRWSWETYWLVGGIFSWILAPTIAAFLLVPNLSNILRAAPPHSMMMAYLFGTLWGIGGLTFGLTVRYLGIALGVAVALGFCAAFGTLIPPLFDKEHGGFAQLLNNTPGLIVLLGVLVSLIGIGVSGLAGMSKEKELTTSEKQETTKEFNFSKGMMVAVFSGILSACMAFGLNAGKPIADLAKAELLRSGGMDLWQNLPVLIIVLLGGFTTNFVWCVILNVRNKSGREYAGLHQEVGEVAALEAVTPFDTGQLEPEHGSVATQSPAAAGTRREPVPLLRNYAFSALAGITWYLQFFFYSMGQVKMGSYSFSSWTLHMASIIIFSTLWGIALHEWRGTSRRTHSLIGLGLAVLIGSTVVIGVGNYLKIPH